MHWIAIGILIGIGLLLAPFVVSTAGWTLYGIVWLFLINPFSTPAHIAHDWKLPPEQKKYNLESKAMGLFLLVLYGSWLLTPLLPSLAVHFENPTPSIAPGQPIANVDQMVDDIVSTGQAKGLSGVAEANPAVAISANTLEAVRNTIRPCWDTSGQQSSNAPVVTLVVQMSEDGTPIKAEAKESGRYNSEPFYRLAADTAWRAVMNPRCQPLPLPRESYNSWRTITFRFNPRDF